ncbi:MAG: type III pantothenate kinase [Zoogloeaceae bacterium]|jgi:type III pantothenate kinase|nr:type III pantothenate kinase [Zoogloeaceae bacterium]
MLLCLDAGNSRLKWGLSRERADDWQGRGALPWADIARLPQALAAIGATSTPPRSARLASVVDREREMLLQHLLQTAYPRLAVSVIRSGAAAAGVVNGYSAPETLGADRWCALIGARALEARPCLVVMAGTATTMDSLDAAGNFMGGLILPGLQMMRAALAQGTALSPDTTSGAHLPFPRNTADAIASGCLEAQIGAIERAFLRLPDAACCLLSGGAALTLLPFLAALPVRHIPDLTLEGLRRMKVSAPRESRGRRKLGQQETGTTKTRPP